MAVEIKIPSVGESITEVVISQWFKKDGDYVERDEPLLEMETDKINQEMPSPESGILRTSAKEGDTLAVGDVVGSIEPGEAPNGKAAKPAEKSAGKPAEAKIKTAPESAPKAEPPAPEPVVRSSHETEEESKEPPPPPPSHPEESPRATSMAKKIATEYGVSLARIEGHGVGGRITREDVLTYVESHTAKSDESRAATPAKTERAVTRERISQLRKKIAVRLVEAQHTAAMLTTFNEIDMTAVMAVRAQYKEAFKEKHGVGLGFMSFFVKAAVQALNEFPRVNAFIEKDEIVYHHYCDIGVAVGTEKGLVVPVIRNCEALSFAGVEQSIRDYAEKARTGGLGLEDLTGGTFTISNGGVYGSMMSTPILNPPQSGILGMHNIIKRPIAVGDKVEIRPMMYVALSYDHRIIDGKEAVGFLIRIKQCIEDPHRLVLDV